MWEERAAAVDAAGASVSVAERVSMQRRVCCRWSFPLSGVQSRVQPLQWFFLSLFVQLLLSSDKYITTLVVCVATVRGHNLSGRTPDHVQFFLKQQNERELFPKTRDAFTELVSATASALSRGEFSLPTPVRHQAGANSKSSFAEFIDRHEWEESNFEDDEHSRDGKQQFQRPAPRTFPRAAKELFLNALASLLDKAKKEVSFSKWRGLAKSATEEQPRSKTGWTLHGSTPEPWIRAGVSTRGSTGENVVDRPAWLLPERRSSPITTRYVPGRDSAICPAVGGFGHPLGWQYDTLENWDELLCRSGGMLRKTRSPELTYDTLVLVKGYLGGETSLESLIRHPTSQDLTNSTDSASADIPSADSFSRKGLEEREASSSGASSRSHIHGHYDESATGALQTVSRPLREYSVKHSRHFSTSRDTRRRKTAYELEDELNEVVDLLSMFHCHLANVVDLRHPSNFQLYANIRQVALVRASVLRRRKKSASRLVSYQGWYADAALNLQTENERSYRFGHPSPGANQDDAARDVFAEVKEPKRERTSSYPTTLSSTSDTMRHRKEHEGQVRKLPSKTLASKEFQFQRNTSSSASSDKGSQERGAGKEDGVMPSDVSEDDSGPVLVVVKNLSTPERLFFGAREIREFLLSRLLHTAYEIRAYNEFRRILVALARTKRSLRLSEPKFSADVQPSSLHDAAHGVNVSSSRAENTPAAPAAAMKSADSKSEKEQATPSTDDVSHSSTTQAPNDDNKRKKAALVEKLSVTDWFARGRSAKNRVRDTSTDQPGLVQDKDDAFAGPPPNERTVAATKDVTTPEETSRHPHNLQTESYVPLWMEFAAPKEEEDAAWWAPLGLRFDLYVALTSLTPDRLMRSPTSALLELVSEPRLRKLVCVYNYDDPQTNIPPVLRANGFVGLPALVLGRRVTTGARSIERLLLSIVDYKPSFPYSLARYAPRFLVQEKVFFEVLTYATAMSKA